MIYSLIVNKILFEYWRRREGLGKL